MLLQELFVILHILRTDTNLQALANVSGQFAIGGLFLRQGDHGAVQIDDIGIAILLQGAVQEVHLGAADEAGNEDVAGVIVQVLRSIDLLDDAITHNNDAVAHGHSFGLVMGNIDEGGSQLLVQLDDLGTHAGTQLSIQVGQRLVKQEDGRVTNHCAAQSNTLALTTGQSLRLTVKQVLDFQDLSSFTNALVDVVLGHLAQFQAECHVLVHGHVRVQSVVLEHHGDVAVFRGNIVDQAVTDVHFALGDFFQTCDHTQGGGLTAAGRTDENDKFLISDFQVEILNGSNIARIDFVNMTATNAGHGSLPPNWFL